MTDIDTLARIIQGEAGLCPFQAMLAVAFLYGLGVNRTFYASAPPSDAATFAASWWFLFDNPAPGAHYLFSEQDTRLPAVQRIIGHDPPVALFECDGGLRLWAY